MFVPFVGKLWMGFPIPNGIFLSSSHVFSNFFLIRSAWISASPGDYLNYAYVTPANGSWEGTFSWAWIRLRR